MERGKFDWKAASLRGHPIEVPGKGIVVSGTLRVEAGSREQAVAFVADFVGRSRLLHVDVDGIDVEVWVRGEKPNGNGAHDV